MNLQNVGLPVLQLWALVFGTSFVLYMVRRGGFEKKRWYLRMVKWANACPANEDTIACIVPFILYVHFMAAFWFDRFSAYPWICVIAGVCLCYRDTLKRTAIYIHEHRILGVLGYLVLVFMGLKRTYLMAPAMIIDLLDTLGWYLLSSREQYELSNQYPVLLHENKKEEKNEDGHHPFRKLLPSKKTRMGKPLPRIPEKRRRRNGRQHASRL